jgi:hypothetical protein
MTAAECDLENEAQIVAERIRRAGAIYRRANEINRSLEREQAGDGIESFDDRVESVDDLATRDARIRSVARRAADLLDELLNLLVVHDSPSVGVPAAGTAGDGEPSVGVASGAASFGAPDAEPVRPSREALAAFHALRRINEGALSEVSKAWARWVTAAGELGNAIDALDEKFTTETLKGYVDANAKAREARRALNAARRAEAGS